MALQFNFTNDNSGLTITNAYAKLGNFHGDKTNVRFDVEIFVSSEARLDNKQPISHLTFNVPYSDGMSIASLYTYMKTLPEFSQAIDV